MRERRVKILRIRLAHYKNVEACDARFSPTGVTIVEGPNESGKSSLGEALDFIFRYPDSSKHDEVRATKQVHADEGTEVEVEIETGAYAFTYFKRWHRRPETRLSITKPRAEQLTARDAHDRANSLLSETIDVQLWRALRLLQGIYEGRRHTVH